MNYIIAANHERYSAIPENLSKRLDGNFIFLKEKEELSYKKLKEINPRYIFIPHWSYIIPEEVYSNFKCIIFHMTDLPFGRGGSPLQNLISRGIYDTKISAIKCVKEIDAGPVYMKEPLSLYGTAEEIYLRSAKIIEDMIYKMIIDFPTPVEQIGEAVQFNRRKPSDGNLEDLESLEKVFDYIRMLDAKGYPKAYIETKHFIFEFQRASFRGNSILADVIIKRKEM
ncbi:hypothetical protein GCM10010978_19460 [Compostibacillus humi]|uniref:Methionyl-tRNA formyltransferase-like C-terminal domain-containing protein n=1 Tax=Compostibacillus humi TaxID=1245525 RepID=A0A8J2TLF9_9BACI|nr:methionyl-tRNA formyltransferase [Compostibacillus humi]GFZ77942.1 hypothetical protein GCM10010978_19460 [Compostibacillus humi]